jgi:2-keto-3-deoxy-L-rhamnonate aldolase RhmA
VVPRLESAAQAAGVVAAVRYCFPDSHRDKIIVVQIETRQAFETLDEFLGVAGIDVLFLGPVDLAKSLGFAGDFRCPEMQRVLREAVARIDRSGGVPGILVDRNNAAAWVRAGARFLYEHTDSFLAAGAESFVASIDGIKAGDSANA